MQQVFRWVRSSRVIVLVVAAVLASGCFKLTSKGPRINVGPGALGSGFNQGQRDPDPTASLVPTGENPWAHEAPRKPDDEHTPRWARQDVEDWLLRSTASLIAGAMTGNLQLLSFWLVW